MNVKNSWHDARPQLVRGVSHLRAAVPPSVFLEVDRWFDLLILAALPARPASLLQPVRRRADSCRPPSTNVLLLLPRSVFPFFSLLFAPSFTQCSVCVCVCVVLTRAFVKTRHGATQRWRWHLLASNGDVLLVIIICGGEEASGGSGPPLSGHTDVDHPSLCPRSSIRCGDVTIRR